MQRDLWLTSVFNPNPVTPRDDKAWQRLLAKYALPYRRMTEEAERSGAFIKFVRGRLRKGHPPKAIAQEAVNQALYPVRLRAVRQEAGPVDSARRRIQQIKREMAKAGEMPVST